MQHCRGHARAHCVGPTSFASGPPPQNPTPALPSQILALLEPPYSQPFAAWLLRHMLASGVRRGRDGHRGSRNAGLLESFAVSVSAMRFMPPLGPKESAFIQELSTAKH